MTVKVLFYSYFKELAGCAAAVQEVAPGATIAELLQALGVRFPKLLAMEKAILVAVGVDYQDRNYSLKAGDEVSLFPPVQGG